MSDFAHELKTDPIRVKYRKISARKVLSGQELIKTRYGTGILNELVVREGEIINEDIIVNFSPYKGELVFRKRDRLLLSRIIELIQNKYDELSSSGTCIKPIYSRPKGYKRTSGEGNNKIYIYELTDIIHGNVSLPYYLYSKSGVGTTMGVATPILARRIRIRLYGNTYSEYKPGNITINEVIDLAKKRYKEYKPAILNLKWGIVSEKEPSQPSRGRFKRTMNGVEFDLVDLLSAKSFLPIKVTNEIKISDNIIIVTTIDRTEFKKGTPIKELWKKWKPKIPDTDCKHGMKFPDLCILDPNLILTGKDKLPTSKGIVTNHKVIIEWTAKDKLCFDRNTPIEYILSSIRRLRRMNDPIKFDHKFLGPDFSYHYPDIILSDDKINFDDCLGMNILIRFSPNILPLFLYKGLNKKEMEEKYISYKEKIKKERTRCVYKAHIWINENKKYKK